jgi:DNA-binding transcriptional LysR family regulator
MRALNPDQLRTFAEVLAQHSFSAAAERLSLTQPAVSQQIRQLEDRLGVRLIERVGKRARATPAGAELLRHVGTIETALGQAAAAMAAYRNEVVGRVRLGTGASACIYLLPALLQQLRRRYPGLEIVIRTGNTPEMLGLLEDNHLDVAFVTLPATGRSFEVTPVIEDELVALFPADAGRLPKAASAASLSQRPLVLYESGGNARRVIDDWFARAGVGLRPVMELGNVEAIKRLVAVGLGCAVLPGIAVSGRDRADGLRVRPLAPRLARTLAVVMRRDKPIDRGLGHVVAALRSLAGGRRSPAA